ncbi:MAG: FAD-dependent oxidoreductase [Patescibacteria group bacterium]|nr:FAD-dependent oxidoreductase [Patescibacteria group bacterium]
MDKQKIVIIGGGAAGTTCAFELRKLDKEAEITIVEKTGNLEYSPCALPYVLAGEINSFDDIFIFQASDYKNNNINILLDTEVTAINKKAKKISYVSDSKKGELTYDKLVLATGSVSKFPSISGLDKAKPFALKNLSDAKNISKNIKSKSKSVIVGAGLVGLELAVALKNQGEKVSVVERQNRPLPAILDKDMSGQLEQYLTDLGVELFFNTNITKVEEGKLYFQEDYLSFDKLFVCIGIEANTALAHQAELKCEEAIEVNDSLRTSDDNIYACGDCVFSIELNTNKKVLSQLGTIAVRQGKVVAHNILGQKEKAPLVVNNTITKIGELFVGSVGLSLEKARQENIEVVTAKYSGEVRSEYYPPSSLITVKLISDKKGKLLGGQILGREEVVGRINLLSLAIGKGMTLDDLISNETCYNPASAPINEPISIVAEIVKKKIKFSLKK